MDYCNSFNGMAYHHSQQHNHEFRYKNGMMKVGYNNNNYNNFYGHNQHINWNGMHHHATAAAAAHHHQYGNRNVSAASCHYDSYKGNMVQNCFQTSSYSGSYETPYESTATAVPTAPIYRSRYGGSGSGSGGGGITGSSSNNTANTNTNTATGYQMCDTQCFPNGDNNRAEYMSMNGGMSRCIGPLPNHHVPAPPPDPRCHQPSFMHESGAHHPHSHMRIPPNHRPYDPHQKRQFDTGPNQSWYGNHQTPHQQQQQPQQQQHQHPSHPHSHPHQQHPHPHPHQHQHHSSDTINETNHHYYQYHTISNTNYNEYPHHINTNGNQQYTAGAPNGQLVPAKDDKPPKMHRDRSLSKLVAMNRRLETQMNESERIEPLQHHEHFENFDYFTDYSETPDSITSSSQCTNNDCMINTGDTDNNNNINGVPNNGSSKNNCKKASNQQVTNDSEWLTISTATTTTTSSTSASSSPSAASNLTTTITTPTTTNSPPSDQTTIADTAAEAATAAAAATETVTQSEQRNELQTDASKIPTDDSKIQADASNNEPSVPVDENIMKKGDLPMTTTTTTTTATTDTVKSMAKQNTNKKAIKSKKANSMTGETTPEKRRKRREKKSNADFSQIRDLKADTTIPLPGFQQAFGSTEIGRFSEIFFNVSGSPIEIGLFESEADTLSPQPQPWEMGDSLEGPHFTPLSYAESLGSTDSPTASNNSYFSDLRAAEF